MSELENLTREGLELLATSMKSQRDDLQRECADLHRLITGLIVCAGGSITVTPDSLLRVYDIHRFDDPISLTTTYTTQEIE